PQAASRKPQAASRKPQAASRKPQAADDFSAFCKSPVSVFGNRAFLHWENGRVNEIRRIVFFNEVQMEG
ncbi:MAG: hypothetical protein LBE85_04890, partial [Candidatus Accumulibacter sp.]|nr:hypothetical protein [Accumulibacter sp.]